MAACDDCGRDTLRGHSCTLRVWDDYLDRVPRERITFGNEPGQLVTGDTCGDCGTPRDGVHHWPCMGEVCPRCRTQAVGCDCATLDDDEDVDDV